MIGAFIKLSNCIDLLDSVHLGKVKSTYEIYKLECKQLGVELPKNKVLVNDTSFIRDLDCQVILRLQQLNNELITQDLELPYVRAK